MACYEVSRYRTHNENQRLKKVVIISMQEWWEETQLSCSTFSLKGQFCCFVSYCGIPHKHVNVRDNLSSRRQAWQWLNYGFQISQRVMVISFWMKHILWNSALIACCMNMGFRWMCNRRRLMALKTSNIIAWIKSRINTSRNWAGQQNTIAFLHSLSTLL